MVPFYTAFHDLALRETRYFIVRGFRGLPNDEYAFLEFYCEDPDCDCRRVNINVISRDMKGKILATISYGWEDAEFYKKEGWGDEDMDPKGPILDPILPQTKLAPYLLELFRKALEDEDYVKRLRRHYMMFKQAIKKKKRKGHRKPTGK